ncbi:hypothetical protein IRP63_02650 [Clostridium botulinum]|uniref:Uncharacterized protein n=1 Tax=Clostridium botulinum C/D str. DC5 TaxID=1443128 RepID=A0A0A0IJE3_CLOBO|nr:hypothetical protein [Clostridium botulinum]KEI07349.1 hypothetical protein Z952_09005 [Clostridium botulinum C/D str. BKT75002]KEI11432.1 hypothetical protein Z954_07705 [Clostridium botulinum C/D str. BKT2873]KGM95351.1 hypothetical protein Z956_05115 [Clostridium botulinum D str. CCUG 7971]KGM99665.1 hypothetical protein Z955_06510 [Clostridium botulinum C/D str. DC5]KOC47535.1 hypothetical protein ADU88_09980 [Clostridium botulinum]
MLLSIKDKKKLKKHIINLLIEKFNYKDYEAEDLVVRSGLMAELQNDPEKVINFDAEFIAEKLVAKSKLN